MVDDEAERLTGRWVHAHEEDRPGETVYRSEGVPLPPSRGRSAFDLQPNGTVSRSGISPDDRSSGGRVAQGQWTLQNGGSVELVFPPDSQTAPGRTIVLHLDRSDPTRLIEGR